MNKAKIITLIFSISCCHAFPNKRYDIPENERSANVKYACRFLSEQGEHSLEYAKAGLYLLINGKLNNEILNELKDIFDQENIKKLNSFVGIGGDSTYDDYKLIESLFKSLCQRFNQETISLLLSVSGNGANREFFDFLFKMNWINGVFDNKDVNKIESTKRTEEYLKKKHPLKKEYEDHNLNRLLVKSPKVPNDLKNKTPKRTPEVPITLPQRTEAQTTVQTEVQIDKEKLKQELIDLKSDLWDKLSSWAKEILKTKDNKKISAPKDTSHQLIELLKSKSYEEIKKAILFLTSKNDIDSFNDFFLKKRKGINSMFSYFSQTFDLGDGEFSVDLDYSFETQQDGSVRYMSEREAVEKASKGLIERQRNFFINAIYELLPVRGD